MVPFVEALSRASRSAGCRADAMHRETDDVFGQARAAGDAIDPLTSGGERAHEVPGVAASSSRERGQQRDGERKQREPDPQRHRGRRCGSH